MKSSTRKPLQPLDNLQISETRALVKPKHVPETHPLAIDASLAEELSAFKKKLQRLSDDRQRTEQLLKQRDQALDLYLNDLLQRSHFQNNLEIEVDRLFRLKELYSFSSKISPIRTLRDKEKDRRNCSGLAISLQVPQGEKNLEILEDRVSTATASPEQDKRSSIDIESKSDDSQETTEIY